MICSPDQMLLRVIKLRRTRWKELVARIRQSRNTNRNWLKKPEGKRSLEDLGVDGKNITISFQGTKWHRMYWIHWVPGKDTWWKRYWTIWFHNMRCWGNIGFWRRIPLYGVSACDTQFQAIQAFELRVEYNCGKSSARLPNLRVKPQCTVTRIAASCYLKVVLKRHAFRARNLCNETQFIRRTYRRC
jgi:hypothetical protein